VPLVFQKRATEFKYSLEARRQVLAPILLRLTNATAEADIKLQALVRILLQHQAAGEKVIIFVSDEPRLLISLRH
jgi:hypothetical protein